MPARYPVGESPPTLSDGRLDGAFDCLCVGDIFYDYLFLLDQNSDIPHAGTAYSSQTRLAAGGTGNIAAGIAALGGKACFLGKAGLDIFSEMYAKDLSERGIAYHISRDPKERTGVLVSLIDGSGERTLIVDRGANDNLSFGDVFPAISALECRFLFVSGFSLFSATQSDTISNLVRYFKKRETMVVFDPGSYNLVDSRRRYFDEVMQNSDLVIPNEREAIALAQESDLDQALEFLSRERMVILKMGERGCQISQNGRVKRYPGVGVEVADTTGAGDAFAAGIIYGLTRGYRFEDTVTLALWFSSEKVRLLGPRSYPNSTAISAFLRPLKDRRVRPEDHR